MDKKTHEYFSRRTAYTDDFEIAEEFSADPYSDSPLQNTIPHRNRNASAVKREEIQGKTEKPREK